MTLKERIKDYAYTYLWPSQYAVVEHSIDNYKDDLSDLTHLCSLYEFLKDYVKDKDLLIDIENAVNSQKIKNDSRIDINSAFIGAIIGLLIGIVLCSLVNLIPK